MIGVPVVIVFKISMSLVLYSVVCVVSYYTEHVFMFVKIKNVMLLI